MLQKAGRVAVPTERQKELLVSPPAQYLATPSSREVTMILFAFLMSGRKYSLMEFHSSLVDMSSMTSRYLLC